jgi:ribonuclease P protein component
MGEANVPAEQPETGEEPRISSSDVDARGPGHLEGPSLEGAPPPVGLTTRPGTVWRVRDRETFRRLRASRRRVRRGPLTVTFVPAAHPAPPQVAYAIGRKVGGAVVRNRLRRRLRAVISELAPQLAPGAYLVGAAPAAASLSFGELQAIVTEALEAVARNRS